MLLDTLVFTLARTSRLLKLRGHGGHGGGHRPRPACIDIHTSIAQTNRANVCNGQFLGHQLPPPARRAALQVNHERMLACASVVDIHGCEWLQESARRRSPAIKAPSEQRTSATLRATMAFKYQHRLRDPSTRPSSAATGKPGLVAPSSAVATARLAHTCPGALLSSLLVPIFICMIPMHAAAVATQMPPNPWLPQDPTTPHLPDVVIAGTHALHALPAQASRRALQSRRRDPRELAICNRCTLCTCTLRRCTGRCRRNGQVRACGVDRDQTTLDVPDALLPFAAAPHIGCTSRDPPGCAFIPQQIAADSVPGFSVDVRNGAVSARCYPEPVDAWGVAYGVCLCDFTSADGREHLSAFCEPSPAFAPLVPRLQDFAATIAAEAGLEVDVWQAEEVQWGGATATVALVVPLQEVDYDVDGEVEVQGPAAA